MALSNMYKPQTNEFLHLDSDDDLTEDEIDDDFNSPYNKNYNLQHNSSKSGVQKPLMHPYTKTKIRRKHTKPWCTAKSCLTCLMWLAFFSICIVGLVLLILRAIDNSNVNTSNDSKVSYTKKVKPDEQSFKLSDESIQGCDTPKASKIWHTNLPKLMSETAIRLNDVNNDGVKDIIVSFSTGVDAYKAPKFSCNLYFNGTYPCFGGALALDGTTGRELWRHYSMHEIYALNCNGDLDSDGIWDCLLGGRGGVFQAISGKSGKMLWDSDDQGIGIMNFYTAQFIRDMDGDGIMEVLTAHGGDPLAEANSPKRLKGRLVIFSGKTGHVLRWVIVPDERETYFSPVLYHKKDGRDMVLFGTGGETHPGGLWVIPLQNLYLGMVETAVQIYEDKFKGVMSPPILVDLNKDGTVDIVMAMFNTTIAAFNGETYKQMWQYTFPSSESYTTPAAGFYNDDDVPDIMVRFNYGPGFPVYYYSQMTVLDGRNGQPLIKPFKKTSVAVNSSPLTVSMEGLSNDLFIYWMADCKGHEGEGSEFSFVEGTNVHEQSRADTCRLRYNTKSFSKLNVMNSKTGFPGQTIYSSDEYEALEHGLNDTSSSQATQHKTSHKKSPHRSTRHIGVPDHGGYQRIIATAGLAPSLGVFNDHGPGNSIDVVFTTYWQYPAKVRVILPEDRACIEHYRKLSKLGKFNNRVSSKENEELGMYDAGDAAVNLCLKKHRDSVHDKDKIYISQTDFDWYKVHFGALTVYRFQITCDCKKLGPTKRCSRCLPMNQQAWGGYMGTLGNSYYLPRD